MGTSLLNCSDENGNTIKIDAVKVISTLEAKSIQNPEITVSKIVIDSTKTITIPKPPTPIKKIDIPIPAILGDVVVVMGDIEPPKPVVNNEVVFGILTVENPPEFKNTPKGLTRSKKREFLSQGIRDIVNKNFNTDVAEIYGIKGKQRILTQFKIDEKGNIKDIKTRASHKSLDEEAVRVINLLPQFIPAKQRNKNVATIYTLPIVFNIKD